jgi:hypothetical protein
MTWLSTIAFVCFLEWGLIHMVAGYITVMPALQNDVSTYLIGLYSGIDQEAADAIRSTVWPKYTNRVLLQHGINLAWAGVWSVSLCYVVLFPPRTAWLLCLPPYFLDIGYFIAIDLVNLGETLSEAQTFIVSIGLFCMAMIVKNKYDDVSSLEYAITLVVPCLLFGAGVVNQFAKGGRVDNPEF